MREDRTNPTVSRALGEAALHDDEALRLVEAARHGRSERIPSHPEIDANLAEEITGMHEKIDAIEARQKQPSISEINIHVEAAQMPPASDSTPPLVRHAWRHRGFIFRTLLWCLGAVGMGAAAQRIAKLFTD